MTGLGSNGAPATLHQALPKTRRARGRQRARTSVTAIARAGSATATATLVQAVDDAPVPARTTSEIPNTATIASTHQPAIRIAGVHA